MTERHTVRIVAGSLLLCGVLALILLLPAFDLGGHASPSGPHRGGSIVDSISLDPANLIPGQTTDGIEQAIDDAIWAPLWYGDLTGVLHPGLARQIPSVANGGISADLKTWTIRLRPNLKWSDGSPLTASDVAFSLNTFADVHFANQLGVPVHDPSDPVDFLGATALDPTTVQFSVAHPNATMLTLLSDGIGGPMPQEIFGAMKPGDIPNSSQNFLPTVVSGPFRVKEHVQGDHLTVVRNPYYYQGPDKPYLDQITFKTFGSAQAVLSAAQEGGVDTAYTVSGGIRDNLLDAYRALPGYTTYLDRYPAGYELLVFNLTNPILRDLAVRQALTMSLDPHQVMALLQSGLAVPTCDDSLGTFAHESTLTCYPQDPARAAQILEQDGWRMGTDGYRYKGGQRLELRFPSMSDERNAWRAATEALAQAAWGRLGVKLDIPMYSASQFLGPILSQGTFDIAEFGRTGLYDPDDHWFFMCNQTTDQPNGSNYGHYCNPNVDQAETLQLTTADMGARKAAFHTIHAAILADLPVMYLFCAVNVGFYRSTLRNYMPSAMGGETWNVWDWYLSAT